MVPRFIITLGSLLVIAFLPAQTWVQKSDWPVSNGDGQGTAFSIGSKIYLVCGALSTGLTNFTWEYDVINDNWSQKASFPGLPRRYPNSFAINGKGYFLGGEDTVSGTNNDFWEYDPVLDLWTQKTSLPGPPRCAAITFVINDKGYICTGAQIFGTVLNDLWEYDPTTDSWTQKSSFPVSGRAWGCGFAIGNKGYAGIGSDYSGGLNDWWEYSPVSDSWAQLANFPTYSFDPPVAFALDGFGYIGPGTYLYLYCYRFDPSTGSWMQILNFPGTNRYAPYFASVNSKGYVISGDSGSGPDNSTWEFTPPVGIAELETQSLALFPNPADGQVYIQFPASVLQQSVEIELSDYSGRVVRKEHLFISSGSVSIGRETLSAGVYILTAQAGGARFRGKIIFN